MSATTEHNRTTVLRLFELVSKGEVDNALALFSEDYVEHNPVIGTARADLGAYLSQVVMADPAPEVSLKHVIAENEYVVVHMHTDWSGVRPSTAAIDIFRFEGDLIAEHWDAVQPLPAPPAI